MELGEEFKTILWFPVVRGLSDSETVLGLGKEGGLASQRRRSEKAVWEPSTGTHHHESPLGLQAQETHTNRKGLWGKNSSPSRTFNGERMQKTESKRNPEQELPASSQNWNRGALRRPARSPPSGDEQVTSDLLVAVPVGTSPQRTTEGEGPGEGVQGCLTATGGLDTTPRRRHWVCLHTCKGRGGDKGQGGANLREDRVREVVVGVCQGWAGAEMPIGWVNTQQIWRDFIEGWLATSQRIREASRERGLGERASKRQLCREMGTLHYVQNWPITDNPIP